MKEKLLAVVFVSSIFCSINIFADTLTFKYGTIGSGYGDGAFEDTIITPYSSEANYNYGSLGDYIGNTRESGSYKRKTLMKFSNLFGNASDQIPIGSTITNADFYVYKASSTFNSDYGLSIYRVTTRWYEGNKSGQTVSNEYEGVTWTNFSNRVPGQPYIDTNDVVNYNEVNYKSHYRITRPSTDSVSYWSEHPDENFGWIFYNTYISGKNDYDLDWHGKGSNYKPYLTVTYTKPVLPENNGYDESLKGYWKFEGDQDYIIDSAAMDDGITYRANYGAIYGYTNAGVGKTEGKFGSAFSFDHNDEYLSTGGSWEWDDGGVEGNTVEAWIKPTSAGLVGTRTIIALSATDKLMLINGKLNGIGEISLTADEWAHVAAVYSDDLLKLYVNGELIGQTAASSTWNDWDYVNIGGNGSNDSTSFRGAIDEVAVYDTALFESEIQSEFLYGYGNGMGSSVPEPTTIVLLLSGLVLRFLIKKSK